MKKINPTYRGIDNLKRKEGINSSENYITRKPSFIQSSCDMNKDNGKLNRLILKKSRKLTEFRNELSYHKVSEYRKRYIMQRISSLSNQVKRLYERKRKNKCLVIVAGAMQ